MVPVYDAMAIVDAARSAVVTGRDGKPLAGSGPGGALTAGDVLRATGPAFFVQRGWYHDDRGWRMDPYDWTQIVESWRRGWDVKRLQVDVFRVEQA